MRKTIVIVVALVALTCAPTKQLCTTNKQEHVSKSCSEINCDAPVSTEEVEKKILVDETTRYPEDFLGNLLSHLLLND